MDKANSSSRELVESVKRRCAEAEEGAHTNNVPFQPERRRFCPVFELH